MFGSGVMGRVVGGRRRGGGGHYIRVAGCAWVWIVVEAVGMRINGRMMRREIVRRTTGTVTAKPHSENPRYASIILLISM